MGNTINYLKSEKDLQIPRMEKLGINVTGQGFEQMVTSLIRKQERSYSEEETFKMLEDYTIFTLQHPGRLTLTEWFEMYKKERVRESKLKLLGI